MFLSWALYGSVLAPSGIQGAWYSAAAVGLILGVFLQEPHYTRPSDAVVNGIALLLVLTGLQDTGAAEAPESVVVAARGLLAAYALGTLVMALVAIVLKDLGDVSARIAAWATKAVERVGSARVLFSVLYVATVYLAFADTTSALLLLYAVWFVITQLQPVERAIQWIVRRAAQRRPHHAAEVAAIEDPGAIRLRVSPDDQYEIGDELTLQDGTALGFVIDKTAISKEPEITVGVAGGLTFAIGELLRLQRSIPEHRSAIARVARNTDLEELQARAPAAAGKLGVREGRILSVEVDGREVLYQLTSAAVGERATSEIGRGFITASARKLGIWNEEHRRFDPVPWLPAPGTTVLLRHESSDRPFDPSAIGHVPGTDFALPVDVHRLVTHNTAILGILGIGKTTLTWELIRRMLLEGIKVVVLDITDRYAVEFDDVFPRERQERLRDQIEGEISRLREDRRLKGDEAGNVEEFRAAIRKELAQFIDGEERLLIVNPGGFGVSRRDRDVKSYREDQQFLASMSMVEITRVIAEVLLDLVRVRARDADPDGAQLCLVLEEAHSLVPEWSSTAEKPEQNAANATVRAILQGRKYGFGTVIVTQRTANVTKSILNQCNTVFAMQVFDTTGMEFLANYIGPTHAKLLTSLQPRQAVVFGRAFETTAPVLIDLNDRKDVVRELWAPRRNEVPLAAEEPVSAEAGGETNPDDDAKLELPPEWDEVDEEQEPQPPPPRRDYLDEDDIPF